MAKVFCINQLCTPTTQHLKLLKDWGAGDCPKCIPDEYNQHCPCFNLVVMGRLEEFEELYWGDDGDDAAYEGFNPDLD